jgi:hypothetical protein
MSLDTFEQSLLGELRHHVATRRAHVRPARRTVALVAGGVAAAGATALALALGTSVAGPTAAFAVESQPDGDVVVTVHDLSDASGLEHASTPRASTPTSGTSPASRRTREARATPASRERRATSRSRRSTAACGSRSARRRSPPVPGWTSSRAGRARRTSGRPSRWPGRAAPADPEPLTRRTR